MSNADLYIGLMSGTSLDAVDAALMDFSGKPKLVNTNRLSLPEYMRQEILALNSIQENELHRSFHLGKQLSRLFSECASNLLSKSGITAENIMAIGSHGQTLRHCPSDRDGYSIQAGDPSTLAELTGITVVADFRNRDIAAGGQGAPLVPAFHQAVFGEPKENRAIVNIGGMANITILEKGMVTQGFDTGPGNVLMDHWAKNHINQSYDAQGNWARSGSTQTALLEEMLSDQFFLLAPPKSTGREKFNISWLEQFNIGNIHPTDIQATLLELTVTSIINALPENIDQIFVCGGGANNSFLMEQMTRLSNKPVQTTNVLGIHPDWVEAAAFAWLARQTINHLPGNLPEATGAKGPRVLGGIYLAN